MKIETVKKLIDDSYERCTTMSDFKAEVDSILEAYKEDNRDNVLAVGSVFWSVNSTGGKPINTTTTKKEVEFIITNLEKTKE